MSIRSPWFIGQVVLLISGFVPLARAQQPERAAAFIFGSRNLSCEITGGGGNYTVVHHAANSTAAHNALAYTETKGYGFEVTNPGNTGGNGSFQFGPFDDSPNGRTRFADTCPEEIYDSFIGFKNFATPCNGVDTDGNGIADSGLDEPCSPPEGGVFRVDLEPGVYRFVMAIGDADNQHAHRIVAEDGGSGPPANMSPRRVDLVRNHDQAQFDIGTARADRKGAGVYAMVGFDDKRPPAGDGTAPDPVFVAYGRDGRPTADGNPDCPLLAVSSGYVRIHALQGNSNPGPGGANVDPNTGLGAGDPNGGDLVLLEVWKVGEIPEVPESSIAGLVVLGLLALALGAVLIGRKLKVRFAIH